MRRTLTFALMLLCGTVVCAQNDLVADSLAADTAYYYDTVEYSAPKRNPIYYFGNPFCDHFCEIKALAGLWDVGIGLDYTYLPEVWGFNVSGMVGLNNLWLSGGADYRLSKPWSEMDWHLYGNAGIRCEDGSFSQIRPTLEAGIRLASPEGLGRFCHTSGTLGVLTDFDGVYVTFGLGLSVTTLLSLLFVFI